jgi:hypothetical protein
MDWVTNIKISEVRLLPEVFMLEIIVCLFADLSYQGIVARTFMRLVEELSENSNVTGRVHEVATRPFKLRLPDLQCHRLGEHLLRKFVFASQGSELVLAGSFVMNLSSLALVSDVSIVWGAPYPRSHAVMPSSLVRRPKVFENFYYIIVPSFRIRRESNFLGVSGCF